MQSPPPAPSPSPSRKSASIEMEMELAEEDWGDDFPEELDLTTTTTTPTTTIIEPSSSSDSLQGEGVPRLEVALEGGGGGGEAFDESSIESKNGTIKALLTSFSDLSLHSPTSTTTSPSPSLSLTPSPTSTSSTTPLPSKTSTIRLSSSLSTLLSSTQNQGMGMGMGKVTHLGSTPFGHAKDVGEGDWDADLDLDDLPNLMGMGVGMGMGMGGGLGEIGGEGGGRGRLGKKGSWNSHISVEGWSEDEDEVASKNSFGKGVRVKKQKEGGEEKEEEEDIESDFDLPTTISTITLSPLLSLRPSLTSLNSNTDSLPTPTSTQPPPLPLPSTTPTLLLSSPSKLPPALSPSETTDSETEIETETETDSDSTFFDDILLPSYFLNSVGFGTTGNLTPPSSSDNSSSSSISHNNFNKKTTKNGESRIDLQLVLKEKLKARDRGGNGVTTSAMSFTQGDREEENESTKKKDGFGKSVGGNGKLEGYRERKEDEGTEHGLELVGEEGLKAGELRERIRTKSVPQAILSGRSGARRAATNMGLGPPRNRVLSTFSSSPSIEEIPIVPSGGLGAAGTTTKKSTLVHRSSSSTTLPTHSSTSTSTSSSTSSSSTIGLGRPLTNRPSSANPDSQSQRRKIAGPPPAPSTALRDRMTRERPRASSLRNSQSFSNLREVGRKPARIDTALAAGGGGGGGLGTIMSPGLMTPSVESVGSGPGGHSPPRGLGTGGSTLRSRKSQANLLATPTKGTTTTGRTLERKRSLQNLSIGLESPTLSTCASSSSSRRSLISTSTTTTPLSPSLSQQTTPRPPSRQNSFAKPTAASSSRIRERVISGGSIKLPPTPRPSSANSQRQSFAIPSSTPTSTTIKPRPRLVSTPVNLSKPKRPRVYGDGTELDAFDDLPTSKTRERERVVQVGFGGTRRSDSVSTIKAPPTTTTTATANKTKSTVNTLASATKRLFKRDLSSGNSRVGSGSGSGSVPSSPKKTKVSTMAMANVKVASKKVEEGKEKKVKVASTNENSKSAMGAATTRKRKESKPRREPQLIRNLGGTGAPKSQGDMKWNPTLHKWEGNEDVLREFDKALSTSTRPALITQLSTGSPSRLGFPSLPSIESVLPSRPNVKVVGTMMFDPERMSWYSVEPDAEEELDFTMGESDLADDESDLVFEDGWERGEQERMLKNRASFMSEGSRDGESDAGVDEANRTAFWTECVEGERRHREEMKAWKVVEDGSVEREWLYDIRTLIMDTRNPQR